MIWLFGSIMLVMSALKSCNVAQISNLMSHGVFNKIELFVASELY